MSKTYRAFLKSPEQTTVPKISSCETGLLHYIDSVKVPSEMPVMVLPQVTLFPQAMLPLCIFEARYRKMLDDVLKSHRMFCIGTVRDPKEHQDEIYKTVSVGLVRVAVGKPDGTTHLILQGLFRARILDLFGGKSYPRAHIEVLKTFGDKGVTVDALTAKVTELVKTRGKLGTELPPNALKFLITLHDPGLLCDLVSFTLIENCDDKQKVLESLDLRVRLRKVIELLQKDIHQLELIHKLQKNMGDDKSKLN
jgi:ATP-dependent Lon protease